jgi:hypothetical protein
VGARQDGILRPNHAHSVTLCTFLLFKFGTLYDPFHPRFVIRFTSSGTSSQVDFLIAIAEHTTKMPALNPPPPRNPDDPGRKDTVLGVTWALTGLALIFIGIRFWHRGRAPSRLGWDDWLIFLAGAIQVVHASIASVAYSYGAGMHDEDLTMDQLINILKWFWITTTPAIIVSIVSRISAAILLVRIFGSKAWFKWFLIIFTIVQTIGGIIAIVFVWTQQQPIESVWNPLVQPTFKRAKNWQNISANVAQSLFAFADLAYVILPVSIIWKLNMPFRNKLGLGIVLSLSLISFVGSVMKPVTAAVAGSQYSASLVILWSVLEQTLVIIISCIPALRHAVLAKMPLIKSIGSSLVRIVSGDGSRKGSSASMSLPSDDSPAQTKYRNLESRSKDSGKEGNSGSRDNILAAETQNMPQDYSVKLDEHNKYTN